MSYFSNADFIQQGSLCCLGPRVPSTYRSLLYSLNYGQKVVNVEQKLTEAFPQNFSSVPLYLFLYSAQGVPDLLEADPEQSQCYLSC